MLVIQGKAITKSKSQQVGTCNFQELTRPRGFDHDQNHYNQLNHHLALVPQNHILYNYLTYFKPEFSSHVVAIILTDLKSSTNKYASKNYL